MRTRASVLIAFLVLSGCAVNSQFVYKPGAPKAGEPNVPVKVAVLPFHDGTPDFTQSGSILSTDTVFNLAKTGIRGTITAVTPELWAKSFADELAASGRVRSAKFVFHRSESTEEDLFVDGTVEKANWANSFDGTNQFALSLVARRPNDNQVVWEKEVARQWKTPRALYNGCGMGIQCMLDRLHGEVNTALQSMFAEAGDDLVRTLDSRAGEDLRAHAGPSAETSGGARSATPDSGESVERTIDRILREK